MIKMKYIVIGIYAHLVKVEILGVVITIVPIADVSLCGLEITANGCKYDK